MKQEKKEQIKELLEEAKQKIEQMKEEMPEESFKQSEAMLEHLSLLLEGKVSRKMINVLILRYIISLFLIFILGFLWMVTVLGFANPLLNYVSVPQFFIIVLSLTAIFVILLKLLTILTNTFHRSPIGCIILFSLITILALAMVDVVWVDFCVSLDASLFLTSILWVGFIGIELWLQKKIFL